ncbi:Tim10/DDP family zinc finger protein [Mycotypha africana]|uniref:Tim10/DDP family zinc finger protein n=1 Tax=Mycotypha africana TaxID=64632 RepID=UPI0023008C8C|nr:Tim10/DDP family zinc finger protein [Mycotypha africana]KAI8988521.1 Tim10/DDP family zinc finger protein [Mycotypha africana]
MEMNATRFNQAEQAEISAMLERKQMADFVHLFTDLTDRCFRECANNFTTKAVTGKEAACVQKCADRFLKHSEIVSNRFAELSQSFMNNTQQQQPNISLGTTSDMPSSSGL